MIEHDDDDDAIITYVNMNCNILAVLRVHTGRFRGGGEEGGSFKSQWRDTKRCLLALLQRREIASLRWQLSRKSEGYNGTLE